MNKKILTLDNVPVINKKIGKIDTIEKLKASTIYSLGDVVEVLGFHAKGDGAHHKRKIKATDDGSGVQLANGLWANIVHNGEVNVSWFGARKILESTIDVDNESCDRTDSIVEIEKAYNFTTNLVIDGMYYISRPLELQLDKNIVGLSPIVHFLGITRNYCGLVSDGPVLTFSKSIRGVDVRRLTLCSLKDVAVKRLTSGTSVTIFISNFEDLTVYGKVGAMQFSDGTANQPGGCYETSFKQIAVGCGVGGFGFNTTNSATRNYFFRVFDIWNSKYRFRGNTMFLNIQAYFHNCNISYTGLLEYYWKATQPSLRATFEDCNFEWITGTCFEGNNSFIIINNSSYLINGHESYFKIFNGSFVDIYINNSSIKIDGSSTNPDTQTRFANITNPNPNIVLNNAVGYSKVFNFKKWNTYTELIDKSLDNDIINRRNIEIESYPEGNIYITDQSIFLEKRFKLKGTGNKLFGIKNTAVNYYFNYVRLKVIGRITNNPVYFDVDILTNETNNKVFVKNNSITAFPYGSQTYSIGAKIENGELLVYITKDGVAWSGDAFTLSVDLKVTSANQGIQFVNSDGSTISYSIALDIAKLDTPYHTLKMQQERIYEDYVAYRDELHEYENSQAGDGTMMLPVLQEPVIPESVKAFAKKYKLI